MGFLGRAHADILPPEVKLREPKQKGLSDKLRTALFHRPVFGGGYYSASIIGTINRSDTSKR